MLLIFLYSFLFTLLFPLAFLRLWLKGRKNKAYREHWPERLGHYPFKLEHSIWLHAVSLGEMVAAAPLIQTLLMHNIGEKLVLTCMTPTGRMEALKWADKYPERVFVAYLPYDIPFCVNRALKSIKPRLLIVMETEMWPNLFRQCAAPIINANARISDRAFKKYQKIRFVMEDVLQEVDEVAAQSELDAKRFQALGARHVSVMGNIKYDLPDPADAIKHAAALSTTWNKRLIITAGSTHAGEDNLLLEAYQKLKPRYPDLLLILVPRHPERFNAVYDLCLKMGLSCARRSQNAPLKQEDIFLVDAMGELKTFYALSDIVFVGGSLITIGGHNILEAAILGKPIFVGPYMQNARKVVEEFLENKALVQVQNPAELVSVIEKLLQDPARSEVLGQNALSMMAKNRGALDHLMSIVSTFSRS